MRTITLKATLHAVRGLVPPGEGDSEGIALLGRETALPAGAGALDPPVHPRRRVFFLDPVVCLQVVKQGHAVADQPADGTGGYLTGS